LLHRLWAGQALRQAQDRPCPYNLVSHRELGESTGEGDEWD
jgi:hypothetical protein